jgi:hypothetical protein
MFVIDQVAVLLVGKRAIVDLLFQENRKPPRVRIKLVEVRWTSTPIPCVLRNQFVPGIWRLPRNSGCRISCASFSPNALFSSSFAQTISACHKGMMARINWTSSSMADASLGVVIPFLYYKTIAIAEYGATREIAVPRHFVTSRRLPAAESPVLADDAAQCTSATEPKRIAPKITIRSGSSLDACA